jgi:hypothetical protein
MTPWGTKDVALLSDEAWVAGVVEKYGSVISGNEAIVEARLSVETLR